jgi:hypothetical protein
MSHVFDRIGGRLIRVRHREVLDATSSTTRQPRRPPGPSWVGDKLVAVLERLLELTVVMPSWLKAMGFVKDRKEAYVYVQRLVKLGVLERTGRWGVYRVRHDVVARLLQLPVRRIAEGIARARRRIQLLTDGGGVRRASPCVPVCPSSVVGLCGVGRVGSCGLVCSRSNGLGYVGLFVDNVRGVRGGVYEPWPGGRGCLVGVRDLRLFYGSVSYFEPCHVVCGVSLEGQVVVYSNSGDRGRFGCCVRVEWRPPEGFVSSAGVRGTLGRSRVELLRAWVALSVVLRYGLGLSRRYLSSLYSWLGRLWGLGGLGWL